MWIICLFLGLAQCFFLWLLARVGRGLPGREEDMRRADHALDEKYWPTAALIIPAAGSHPRMETALKSLLSQDYPRLLPVLVTAEADEAAARLIRDLQQSYPGVQHVTAGMARTCGQKNHNSLCGVAAVGDAADVYVFCDSTHLAQPDFVRSLVGPIARGESAFSTGYHTVEPRDEGLVTLAYALCVQLMRLLQALSAFTQPWGGAMAMSRVAFERHKVAELWGGNVVDDCSLAGLLQSRGEKVCLCPGALLRTEAENHSLPVWQAWMDRQVLFLKFCIPGQWRLLGGMILIMLVPQLWAVLTLLGGAVGLGSGAGVLTAFLFLAALAASLNAWRAFFPAAVPLWRWMLALGCASAMFTWVYLRSLWATGIGWHGIEYLVGRGGVVRGIRR